LPGVLNRTQVNSKERSEVTIARNRVEAEDTKVTAGETTRSQHGISVGPKRDQRQKLGEVMAARVTGTNAAKSKLHGSEVEVKCSSDSSNGASEVKCSGDGGDKKDNVLKCREVGWAWC
jgi:hypothetical protein